MVIELTEANPGITVEFAGDPVEADPLVIIIRANCAWELSVSCAEEVARDDGLFSYQTPRLFWQMPEGSGWESLLPEFLPASTNPVLIARGDVPAALCFR